ASFAGGSPLPVARNELPGPPRPQIPGGPPLSGARTLPGLQKAQPLAKRTLHVEASDVLDEISAHPPKRMGAFAILILLVLTAAAAGAVVYFGLPYIYTP